MPGHGADNVFGKSARLSAHADQGRGAYPFHHLDQGDVPRGVALPARDALLGLAVALLPGGQVADAGVDQASTTQQPQA